MSTDGTETDPIGRLKRPRERLLALFLPVLLVAVVSMVAAGRSTAARSARPSVPAITGTGWTTYHADNARDGADPSAPSFAGITQPANSWAQSLDAPVYAEPLALGGVVYVATERNTIYALDERTGGSVWPSYPNGHHLESPATGGFGCGNINPDGITGTPVIDPSKGVIYAVGENAALHFDFYALNLADGSLAEPITDVTPAGMPVADQGERGALALSAGRVYVPFGGRAGDCRPYHTYVDAVPATAPASFSVYAPQSSPPIGTDWEEAGVWAPSGESVDPAGNVYIETGNGAQTSCSAAWDHGDGVVKLSSSLQELSAWAPSNWCGLNAADADLGSVAPLLLAGGVVFAGGKSGDGWLLDSSSLGGVGGTPLFASHIDSCPTSDAVFGGFAALSGTVFVPCDGTGLVALNVTTTSPYSFGVRWHSGSFSPGPPIVAGGLVWTVSQYGGKLYGFDADSGALQVTAPVGPSTKFVTPTSDGGWIFVPTSAGLSAFDFNAPPPPPGSWPSRFHRLPPTRVLDTRTGVGTAPGSLGPGQDLSVKMLGQWPIPAGGVSAVVLNVTATGQTSPSYLSVCPTRPCGTATSNLNFTPGSPVPNLVVATLSSSGFIELFNLAGQVDVVADAFGYIGTSADVGPDGHYQPVTPTRILDTRTRSQGFGALLPGGQAEFGVAGRGGVPVKGVEAVVLNLTAAAPTQAGWLSLWPSSSTWPGTSNLNFGAHQTRANRVVVPLGPDGGLNVLNLDGTTDVVADVVGYYTDATGSAPAGLYTAVSPARVMDTRIGQGWPHALGTGAWAAIRVSGLAGLPSSGVAAVLVGLTATNPPLPGYLEVNATGSGGGQTSDLNFVAGETVANAVIAPVDGAGYIHIFNLQGSTDVLVDVFGYYN